MPQPAVLVLAGVLGVLLLFANLAATHDPQPHGVPIGVEGAPAELWQSRLDGAGHGAYTVHEVSSAEAAVRSRSVYAAVSAIAPVVHFAGANGAVARRDILRVFEGYAPNDVVPLQAGDPSGVAVGQLVLATILAALAAGALAPRSPLVFAAFAVAFGFLAALAVGPAIGALAGHFLRIWLWVSASAFTIAVGSSALARLLGSLVGFSVAALCFLVLGTASSGASAPLAYLPGLFRLIGPILPPNALAEGLLGTTYFDASVWRPALVLAVWAGAACGALLALNRRDGGDAVISVHDTA